MIATEEQQTAIPPIVAVEPTASVPTAVAPAPAPAPSIPTAVAPAPAPAPTEDVVPLLEEPAPLIVLDSEIAGVEGSTIDQFIAASPTEQTAPIAGGILTDGTATNTPEGDAKIQEALSTSTSTETTAIEAGERIIEPLDCTGLTGESCCLLIKLKVRDSDINGNAIQCTLDYITESQKKQFMLNHRGKKVHIFANHNDMVSKVPEIVGDWPKGIKDNDFPQWLLEAGNPPLILQ